MSGLTLSAITALSIFGMAGLYVGPEDSDIVTRLMIFWGIVTVVMDRHVGG